MSRIGVIGGHGKTGQAVSAALAARGAEPVALGRADREDPVAALEGCAAVYVIAPNMHPDEATFVAEAAATARAGGVPRLVLHSVASPYSPAMPHHLGKARAEDVVRRSGLAWTILEPGTYAQNIDFGRTVRIPYRADVAFGFADLGDVAEVAATVLLDDGHVGATYELASFTATVADLAAVAGVGVEVITPAEWASTQGVTVEPRVRDWLLGMFAYYDRHGFPVGTLPMRTLLGRPPATLATVRLRGAAR